MIVSFLQIEAIRTLKCTQLGRTELSSRISRTGIASEDDLTYNNIRRAPYLSPHRQSFQDRLQRKGYIDNAIGDVRAVIFLLQTA